MNAIFSSKSAKPTRDSLCISTSEDIRSRCKFNVWSRDDVIFMKLQFQNFDVILVKQVVDIYSGKKHFLIYLMRITINLMRASGYESSK